MLEVSHKASHRSLGVKWECLGSRPQAYLAPASQALADVLLEPRQVWEQEWEEALDSWYGAFRESEEESVVWKEETQTAIWICAKDTVPE